MSRGPERVKNYCVAGCGEEVAYARNITSGRLEEVEPEALTVLVNNPGSPVHGQRVKASVPHRSVCELQKKGKKKKAEKEAATEPAEGSLLDD